MKKQIVIGLLACLFLVPVTAMAQKTVKIKMVETSDVHSAFFAQDANGVKHATSLSRVSAYVKNLRTQMGENLILMDNGDILQGRPDVYYMNYVAEGQHQVARMLNYMKYDVVTFGNHDVETSHSVYDHWIEQCNMPVLGANVIDTHTGKPWLPPYQVFEREGVKIAVLGMITPTIPSWLAESMWTNLRFQDMVECAKLWVPYIQQNEKPDVLIGMFHSGKEGSIQYPGGGDWENQTKLVAQSVAGFDAIFYGHDHTLNCEQLINPEGNPVWIIDPANQCGHVGVLDIEITKGQKVEKKLTASLQNLRNAAVDEDMEKEFQSVKEDIQQFISRKIGKFDSTIESKYAFVGPCSFISLIHDIQMQISGAPISITAPLALNSVIKEGDVTVNDMFQLYRFENFLYAMRLTGRELKGLLEMSYGIWTNQMKNAEDDLLLLNGNNTDDQRRGFKEPYYNFDSAQGINYTVDVTKPMGEKLTITTLADGTPFSLDKEYIVAINSYRANGGGDLITLGAGIPKEELASRIVFSTDRDLRYYLMKYIEEKGVISPRNADNWHFVPENWTIPAAERNMKTLFK